MDSLRSRSTICNHKHLTYSYGFGLMIYSTTPYLLYILFISNLEKQVTIPTSDNSCHSVTDSKGWCLALSICNFIYNKLGLLCFLVGLGGGGTFKNPMSLITLVDSRVKTNSSVKRAIGVAYNEELPRTSLLLLLFRFKAQFNLQGSNN